jgi:hypothetical protein
LKLGDESLISQAYIALRCFTVRLLLEITEVINDRVTLNDRCGPGRENPMKTLTNKILGDATIRLIASTLRTDARK